MSYRKILTTKIVRTTHVVTFSEGFRVDMIIDYLGSVPKDATVSDLDLDDSGILTIKFIEEQETT